MAYALSYLTSTRGIEISTTQLKDVVAENDKTVDGMTRDGKRSKKEAETKYPKSMKTSTCKNCGANME